MQLARLGYAKNKKQKLELLVSASRKGLSWAQYELGDILLQGLAKSSFEESELKDHQKAGVYWLHKSALSGFKSSQKLLAEKLTHGIDGVLAADYEEAIKWSNLAKFQKVRL